MSNRTEWIAHHAYMMAHTTAPDFVRLRTSGTFVDWVDAAFRHMHYRSPNRWGSLPQLYEDLLTAWQVAERSRPITMDGMTYGELVRHWETAVMPAMDLVA